MRFRNVNGAPAKLTLGSVDLSGKEFEGIPVIGQQLTLAAARLLAAEKLRARAMGNDVFADHAAAKRRRRAQHEQAAANTFGGLARQFIDEHAQRKTRRWRQTARVLGLMYPLDGTAPNVIKGGLAARWADKPVTAIDGHDIYALVMKRGGVASRAWGGVT